jgi:hypothetical protein
MMRELCAINAGKPPPGPGQVRAFLCVRNEIDRLPYLLSHYRRAGVDWFFAVDNGSHDGTVEFLAKQPDCSLFTAHDGFANANFGMDWINALMEAHGTGHWRLFIDADEILVYPHSESITIPVFCDYLKACGHEGVYAFMLDMYSAGSVAESTYKAGEDFLEVCPLFDRNYAFCMRPSLPGRPAPFPPFEVTGGPRLRRLYPEFNGAGYAKYLAARGMAKLRNGRLGRALQAKRWLCDAGSPPLLSKMPLSFGIPGRVYVTNHRTVPLNLAPVTGALLHFKFFADFHNRVTTALTEGQHFDGGSEYARYAEVLRHDPAMSLADAESASYRDTRDLIRFGMLRTAPEYEMFVSELNEKRSRVRAISSRERAAALQ